MKEKSLQKSKPKTSINKKITKYHIYYGGNINFIYKLINMIYTSGLVFLNNKSCFTNGTFIFEDNKKEFFKYIVKNSLIKNVGIYKTTHKLIKKNRNYKCSSNYLINACNTNIIQYEIRIIPDINIKCNNDVINKKICLLYNFTINNNNEIKHYTFFKLEDHPAISMNHNIVAIKRYIFKKEPYKISTLRRREDCELDKNKCSLRPNIDKYYKNLNSTQNVYPDIHLNNLINYFTLKKDMLNLNNLQKSISFYDKNVRTGDEYFVPQIITDNVVKMMQKK